ncbi:MAG TPA: hypothetical protein DHV26_15650 [Cytophagales bacterium]|nr:hypothetical protein [Cytophagales bacterium]
MLQALLKRENANNRFKNKNCAVGEQFKGRRLAKHYCLSEKFKMQGNKHNSAVAIENKKFMAYTSPTVRANIY